MNFPFTFKSLAPITKQNRTEHNTTQQNRKMIGNTPFTSLHISHWKNYKKCDDEKEIIWMSMLVLCYVLVQEILPQRIQGFYT